MSAILNWLGQQVTWVILICLIGALSYSISAVIAKRKYDLAQFSLEREVYHRRMARAWLVVVLFLMLAAVVWAIHAFWAPMGVSEEQDRTTTPSSGLYTATPGSNLTSAGVLTASDVLSGVIVSTAIPAATASPTPVPTPLPSALLQPDCPDPGAQLTFPVAGGNLSGVVEVLGTARVNAFSYYRFEVVFPGSDVPSFVAQYDVPIEDGVLGVWDVSDSTRYPPGGPYQFRLVVVDIYGNTTICRVPVNIVSQQK